MSLDEFQSIDERAAKEVTSTCNIMCTNFGEVLGNELKRSHRTIQQSTVRELLKAITMLADEHTDMRNEKAVDAAKKIKQLDLYFPFV